MPLGVSTFQSSVVWPLERKDLVLELAHGPGLLVADGLGGLLQTADHRGRAAEQDLDVVGGLGKPFLHTVISTTTSACCQVAQMGGISALP